MPQATDRTTSPEDRLLAAFSCLNRLDRELAMLAVSAEASVSERRAEAIEETIRAVMTVRLHLRSATRGWIEELPAMRMATAQDIAEGATVDGRGMTRVRADEKLTDAERRAKWGYVLDDSGIRDQEELAEASHYLAGFRDTDTDDEHV